jgi:hypothetical protein
MALVSCRACEYHPIDTSAHHCPRCGCTSPFLCAICGKQLTRLDVHLYQGRVLCPLDAYRQAPKPCVKCGDVTPNKELGEVIRGWNPQWNVDGFARYWPVKESGWCAKCRAKHPDVAEPEPPEDPRPPLKPDGPLKRKPYVSKAKAGEHTAGCGGILALMLVLLLLAALFIRH